MGAVGKLRLYEGEQRGRVIRDRSERDLKWTRLSSEVLLPWVVMQSGTNTLITSMQHIRKQHKHKPTLLISTGCFLTQYIYL